MKQKTNLTRRAALLLLTMLCSLTGAWANELTVYDGTTTNRKIPAYIFYFDDFTKSQFVIPASDLANMAGGTISSLKFYTNSQNIPYTTTSEVDVYLMEVDYTTMTGFEPKANGTIVYQGTLDIVSEGDGGSLTIEFENTYNYGGGNLLIGIDNTTDAGYKSIYFCGTTVTGAGWSGSNGNSLDNVTGEVQNFIPQTTFTYTGGTVPLGKPVNLTVTGITPNSATVNWNNPDNDEGLSGFVYQYKESSEESWSNETNISSHSASLTGLTSNTAYNFRVKALYNNGANESGYSTINFTTKDPCAAPTNLIISDITASSATLSWTAGYQETSWIVKYKKSTEEEYTEKTVSGTPTIALSGLESSTTYNVKVYNCTGEADPYLLGNFTTAATFPYSQDFSGSGIPAGWAQYSGLLADVMNGTSLSSTTYGWSNGTSNGALDGNHLYSNIYGTSRKAWIVTPAIPLGSNARLAFDVAYTAYSGTAANPETNGDDDKFAVLISTDNMATWTILRQWDNAGSEYVLNNLTPSALSVTIDLSTYAGQSAVVAFYAESTVENADNNIHVDNVAFEVTPSCEKPTSLAVNYTGGTTAQVSWTSDATAFDIDVNGTVTQNVTNPYQLKNLYLATTYTVKVRAKNGSDVSDWTSPVSFSTDICSPEDQKEITYELADSYGDGWNGAAINVVHVNTGIVVATLTLASGSSETGTISLCCGEDYSFVWKAGNYDSECSYAFYDVNEEEIFSGNGSMSDAVNYTMDCTVTPWKTPTNLKASEIGPKSVKLSWTEKSNPAATAWVVAYKSATDADFTEVNVTTNPFTLTGLTPETAYTVKVRPATNEVVKWSDELTFTTLIAAPVPTDLAVTPFVTTADVSWNGFAENYELEYAEGAFGSSWLQYDDGIYGASIGNSSSATWTWGVMYPGSMVTGNKLTKVSIFETSGYNTEDITINIYQGGDDAPGTLLYTETVTPNAADAFHEITLATPVDIDPDENLWITLTEYGTYVLSYCASDEPNNNWVLYGDAWAHVGDLNSSLAGDGWMIRGEIINENSSTATWIPVSNPSSPCTLEGLTAETAYTVRVRGDFGSDGKSGWAMKNFTTKSVNDIPIDLAATDITPTSATLNWTGYQDSFNLKYRHSVTVDPSTPATIILEADDVWEDGSGYQMLLDADADTYGTLWNDSHNILVDGEQYNGGDLPTEYYDEFEYKIPISADGALSTTNVVVTGTVTLTIPAGTYDYVILNPTPGDKFYIVANNGEVGGAEDDFVFEPGMTYHFTIQRFGQGDGAAFETIRPMGEWTAVDNVTNPYKLSGLTPGSAYEWQVQGNLTSGTTAWSEVASFTTLSLFSGDVNGDGNRSITDAVAIVNYVLGNPPAGFIAAAADVNGDGTIDISDAVAVVNIVLNKTGK